MSVPSMLQQKRSEQP